MLYALFLVLAVAYNFRKFRKERALIYESLREATSTSHREMILAHQFYVFIFEGFLAVLAANLITEKAVEFGILGLGAVYVLLLVSGFYLYQLYLRHLERHTGLELRLAFRLHVVKELRVGFALVLLPILIYSMINWAFHDDVYREWGSFWVLGLIFNVLFVSVLTIACSVIVMLKLIPNREVTEPEYLELIRARLGQAGVPNMRVRWIESDMKNAFVVGLKLLRFSNQTIFIGRTLRDSLTREEFDAVIAHELGHVAGHHIQKRVLGAMKSMLICGAGLLLLLLAVVTANHFLMGPVPTADPFTPAFVLSFIVLILVQNFWTFSKFRSQEYEADAFAVMELGASLEGLESALRKMTNQDSMPHYLRSKVGQKSKHPLMKLLGSLFSTHPTLEARIASVRTKIRNGVPFDHHESPLSAFQATMRRCYRWQVAAPGAAVLGLVLTMATLEQMEGERLISRISSAAPEALMGDQSLVESINSAPGLYGPSAMYYVVKRKDSGLISHFLSQGADPAQTLSYILLARDQAFFEEHFRRHSAKLSEQDYHRLLMTAMQLRFPEAYRRLASSTRFQGLRKDLKADVLNKLRHYQEMKERKPASATR